MVVRSLISGESSNSTKRLLESRGLNDLDVKGS